MKKPYEMPFAEFVANANPKGSAQKLPELHRGLPVYSYTVFMDGPVMADMPGKAQRSDYKDVMVTALTRQLGLDPKSFRDNLKVCELVAARSAWLECVSAEHQRNQGWGIETLSGDVLKDYEQLTKGMVHPFIQGELEAQRRISKGLPPLLEAASRAAGRVVSDVPPEEVSVGRVVSQSDDFTVQQTKNGEIVTHDNRRLEVMPKLNTEVAIMYYKGSGQVVDTLENVKVSEPFIDKPSGDLAIELTDGRGRPQIVLFSSLTGFNQFVGEHGLDAKLVERAMDVRAATPKLVALAPKRDVDKVYVDASSGCLAVDYRESEVRFTALFADAKAMAANAKEFGLSSSEVALGRALEVAGREVSAKDVESSLDALFDKMDAMPGVQKVDKPVSGRPYSGKVVAMTSLHIAQNIGCGNLVVHDLRNLDKVPMEGESFKVKYANERGRVEIAREGQAVER